jgi:hypothetical protein
MKTQGTLSIEVCDTINLHAQRLLMVQELAGMAIESLPNTTDTVAAGALLNGMVEILRADYSKMARLHETLEARLAPAA